MFELKFDKTYDHYMFYKYDVTEPVAEDYYRIDDGIFCIADGVTKDLTDGTPALYPENLEELKLMAKYPNPSGNYEVSKICCDKFVEYVKECNKEEITKERILDIAKKVNGDMCKINDNRYINYLSEDVHSAQAAGGIIVDNFLYCFSLGDTQITLLDENFNIVFDTPANEKFLNYENEHLKSLNFNWDYPEYRYMIRRFFRNNPSLKHNGEDITYGALGEKEAEYYINTFKLDLSNVKYICTYSDGVRPFFGTKEENERLIGNPEGIKESGNEKTLIIYEKV